MQSVKIVFCFRQSNVRRLLLASDYCRALQVFVAWTVLSYSVASARPGEVGSWEGLPKAAEYLIDGSEELICRLSFEFWSLHVIEMRSKIVRLRFKWLAPNFLFERYRQKLLEATGGTHAQIEMANGLSKTHGSRKIFVEFRWSCSLVSVAMSISRSCSKLSRSFSRLRKSRTAIFVFLFVLELAFKTLWSFALAIDQ